jgi:hypothetical protein
MTVQSDFLAKALAGWPRLPDAELAECKDEEKALVRGLEEQGIQAEFAALSDIVLNCHNKYQFAKTYKVLRADSQKTFTNGCVGNPQMPAHVNKAVHAAFVKIVQAKLRSMAEWFFVQFADNSDQAKVFEAMNKGKFRPEAAIEQYAGKGDAEGCFHTAVVLLALLIGAPGGACYWLLS